MMDGCVKGYDDDGWMRERKATERGSRRRDERLDDHLDGAGERTRVDIARQFAVDREESIELGLGDG